MQLQITYMKIMWNNYAQTTRYNDECSNMLLFYWTVYNLHWWSTVLSRLGTPYINCVYDLYYVYSHFENQLGIINITLGHAMFNVTRSRLFLPTFPNK